MKAFAFALTIVVAAGCGSAADERLAELELRVAKLEEQRSNSAAAEAEPEPSSGDVIKADFVLAKHIHVVDAEGRTRVEITGGPTMTGSGSEQIADDSVTISAGDGHAEVTAWSGRKARDGIFANRFTDPVGAAQEDGDRTR